MRLPYQNAPTRLYGKSSNHAISVPPYLVRPLPRGCEDTKSQRFPYLHQSMHHTIPLFSICLMLGTLSSCLASPIRALQPAISAGDRDNSHSCVILNHNWLHFSLTPKQGYQSAAQSLCNMVIHSRHAPVHLFLVDPTFARLPQGTDSGIRSVPLELRPQLSVPHGYLFYDP